MTSLAKQLQRLAVPHTQSVLTQDKRRPSLLFDPKEAATLDREAVHALGVSGLEELENLDASFVEFENNLFNKASQNWERSQQTAEINAQLDGTISHFLIRLSPYFLLKSAHKAFEWLLYRYHIHQYNIDEVLQCVLPYHETRIFVRVIQLLPISEPTNKWHWLKSSADGGVPLARSTLVTHCIKDPGFLNFLSDIVPKYIKVHGASSTHLRALISFYTCTLLGALQNKMDINERLVGVLVPTIIRGLKSKCVDHKAGAYMVLSQLVNQSQLKSEFLTSLLPVLTKHLAVALMKEGLLCLTLVYQTQNIAKLPKKSFKHLCRVPGLASLLATLTKSYELSPLLGVYLERLVPIAVKSSASEASSSSADSGGELGHELPCYSAILNGIITDVKLSEKLADQVTRSLLMELLTLRQHMDVDGDESPWRHHAKMLLGQMERKYAEAFDGGMEAVLKTLTSKEDREALQDVLAATSVGVKYQLVPESSTSLMLALSHPKQSMRVLALQHLSRSQELQQDLPVGFLADMLITRLDDDKPEVVKATLDLKELLLKVVDPVQLGNKLLSLVKSHQNEAIWKVVVASSLEIVCNQPISDVVSDLELHLLPLLLVPSPASLALSVPHIILQSVGTAQLPLLSSVANDWLGIYSKLDTSSAAALHAGVVQLNVCLIESIARGLMQMKWQSCLSQITSMSEKCDDKCLLLMTILILSQIIEQKKDVHPEIITVLVKMMQLATKKAKKVYLKKQPSNKLESNITNWCESLQSDDEVPMKAVAYALNKCIVAISTSTKLPDDASIWWSTCNPAVSALVEMTDLLMKLSCNHDNKDSGKSSAWQKMLTKCFQDSLSSAQTYNLLSLIWTHTADASKISPMLHVGSMYLLAQRWRSADAEEIGKQFTTESSVLASLLMNLLHPHVNVRQGALSCLHTAKKQAGKSLGVAGPLIKKLVKRQEEILADPDHVPYVVANVMNKSPAAEKSGVLDTVLDYVRNDATPVHVKERLLYCLQATPHDMVLESLIPVGEAMLKICEDSSNILTPAHLEILKHVLARLDADTAKFLEPNSTTLAFLCHALKVITSLEGHSTPQMMALEQVTRQFFQALPSVDIQQQLVSAMLDAAESAVSVDVVNQAQKMLRQLKLEVAQVSHELQPVQDQDAKTVKSRRRTRRTSEGEVKLSWKRLTILLEVLQARKAVTESEQLVLLLFKVLSKLLTSPDDEEMEYRKKLVLSCVYNMTSRWKTDQIQPKQENFDMAVLVQCVRGGNSPATQQQALLVMASVAKFFPEYILDNIMLIFTFVGTGLLAQDDSHSFQIITHTIQTVIPALLQARQDASVGDQQLDSLIAGIFQVFVDARTAVPRHRCLTVFRTLTQTLGADDYLWLVLTLLVASSIRTKEMPQTPDDPEVPVTLEADMEFAVDISDQFAVGVQTRALVQILGFLQELTDSHQGHQAGVGRSEKTTSKTVGAVSIADLDAKQLRLFQFHLTKLVSAILVKESYVTQVVDIVSGEEPDNMDVEGPDFHTFVQEALCYLVKVAKAYGTLGQKSVGRFWKALLSKVYEVLDKVNYLLPLPVLLEVVSSLMKHSLISVRRKSLDLLNSKLQHLTLTKLTESEVSSLLSLVDILTSLAEEKHTDDGDSVATCQMALFSLKLLCKLLGAAHPQVFTKLFPMTIALIKKKELAAEVLGSDLLCIAELCSILKAHAIPHLSAFVPPLLKILKNRDYLASHELVLTCSMTCLHRLVLSLPLFLSPYLTEILLVVCQLGSLDNLDDPAKKSQPSLRLKAVRHQLATTVAARVLIPALGDCFSQLQKMNQPSSLIALMLIAQEHVETISREDLTAQQTPLLGFFTQMLDVRNTSTDMTWDDTEAVENAVIAACLAMVVRLSEASFRPMFYKLYDWACRDDTDVSKNRKLAFFKLADKLSGKLRSLFNLFVRHTLQAAARLLDANNTLHAESDYFIGDVGDHKSCLLLTHILSCLTQCMVHDTEGLFKKDVFNLLLKPLVDQIENMRGGEDAFKSRIVDQVSPCLGQFAVAAQDDTSWKMLNYQVLLKMRHSSSQVRFAALQVVESIAQKLGEEYMVLIPETIPFLAELMEDEVEEVEHRCQQVIGTLEQVLGESLQKYF